MAAAGSADGSAGVGHPFRALGRRSTPALIADQLRAEILAGTFPPHAQLTETELARQLQVSRGPVREAMQRLIQEGLLRAERNRGAFVTELDHDDARDIYLARGAIERAAVAIVTRQPAAQALARLQSVVDSFAASAGRPWSETIVNDLGFHEAMVDAAGSPRLSRMFRTLAAETRLCMLRLEPFYPEGTEVVAEHQRILDAIASGDVTSADRLVELHMDAAAARLSAPANRTLSG